MGAKQRLPVFLPVFLDMPVQPEDIDCVSAPCIFQKLTFTALCKVIAELPEELREQFGEDFEEACSEMFRERHCLLFQSRLMLTQHR